ncbi:MAG: NAD(P)/FAD-dependent oxidoreductase [Candidatus Pelethousia sp.]|nr:NAD(P)/FAD-dependent oxidoreductase [Candidatus Pelethousia sp.]
MITEKKRVAVIGGGPAGMLAAGEAASRGHEVTLLEKNEKTGKKLYITGKGRCNLTNACAVDDIFQNIPRNPKFLYSALYSFTNQDIIALVERMGTPTKVERGNRVFPASDHASDVLRALTAYVRQSGAAIRLHAHVEAIRKAEEGTFLLTINNQKEAYDAVILCTGGLSYPGTGSTGEGYAMARSLGHTITPCKPSLISLVTKEDWPELAMGLSLRNVTLRAERNGKVVFSELGEMLFTHFGVSGPLVLSASSRIADNPAGCALFIDLKPGLSPDALDNRLMRDFEKNARRRFANSLDELLPSKLIPIVVKLSAIPADIKAAEVSRPQRQALCALLKALPLTVERARGIEEAVITRGGVNVKEINASTMESKLVPGLFFAGEIIDTDAYTGGFNLQIAYSTGALAGRSV